MDVAMPGDRCPGQDTASLCSPRLVRNIHSTTAATPQVSDLPTFQTVNSVTSQAERRGWSRPVQSRVAGVQEGATARRVRALPRRHTE